MTTADIIIVGLVALAMLVVVVGTLRTRARQAPPPLPPREPVGQPRTSSRPPPRKPTPKHTPGMPCLFAFTLLGCSSLESAKVASNGLRTELHREAAILREECLDPYAKEKVALMTPTESQAALKEYDRSGCARRLRAYDTARTIHVTLRATIGAAELGECVGVSRSVEHCDIAGAVAAATQATVLLAAKAGAK